LIPAVTGDDGSLWNVTESKSPTVTVIEGEQELETDPADPLA
jgi:hypothetical protein